MCWEEFRDAPINHLNCVTLLLELRGSQGEMNAYVNGSFQADIRRRDGQFVLSDRAVKVMMKLHNRGDHAENGLVRHISVQKSG